MDPVQEVTQLKSHGVTTFRIRKLNFILKLIPCRMGGKLEDLVFKKRNFQPGPGAYEIKSLENPPTTKFGSEKRADLSGGKETKQKPGPGTYGGDYRVTVSQSPNWGFGSGQRTEEDKQKAIKFVPGPGTYMSKTFVGKEGSKISMAAHLSFDPPMKEGKAKPGPGSYEPNYLTTKKKDGMTKFGTETRRDLSFEKMKLFQQDPGTYQPNFSATKQKASEWRFGSENRPAMVPKGLEKVPGPDKYSLPS